MVDVQGNGLVLLLCVPRSGSSLSTVMLQNHSRIFATQEMWFLMNLVDLSKADARPYGGSPIIRQFYSSMVSDDVYEKACRSFALEIYNGFLQGMQQISLSINLRVITICSNGWIDFSRV